MSLLCRTALGLLVVCACCFASLVAAEDAPPQAEKAEQAAVAWGSDYAEAMKVAEEQNKMLLVYFCDACKRTVCGRFKTETLGDADVCEKLQQYVCVQVPVCQQITVGGKAEVLIKHGAFREMLGCPGIAIVDFANADTPHFGRVVSTFPITRKLWYTPEQMAVILDLPCGTLTQRTLIYAVRTHPDKPGSTEGEVDANLMQEALSHSKHQASIKLQGHHQWDSRFQRISAQLPGGLSAVEVCAESWPGEHLVEAAVECVRCWRFSDGHWASVRAAHPRYGYDMRRGSNGIWYATGIFGRG